MAKVQTTPVTDPKQGDLVLWRGGVCLLAWAPILDSSKELRLVDLKNGSTVIVDEIIYGELTSYPGKVTLSNE